MTTPNAHVLAAQLNAASKLPGKFEVHKLYATDKHDQLQYTEGAKDSRGGPHQHAVNLFQNHVVMVTRRGGGKKYTELLVTAEGGLDAAGIKKVISMVKAQRTKYIKTVTLSYEYCVRMGDTEKADLYKSFAAKMGVVLA